MLVTVILPVFAPVGTLADMCVLSVAMNCVALVPPKATDVTVSRLVPTMVTVVPTEPDVGEKLVMVGAGTTWNESELVAAAAAALLTVGVSASADAAACRDAEGKFIKCPPTAPAKAASKKAAAANAPAAQKVAAVKAPAKKAPAKKAAPAKKPAAKKAPAKKPPAKKKK